MTQFKKGDRVEYVGHYDPWFGKQGMVVEAKSGELICVLMDGIHDVNDGRKSLSFEASTLRVIKDHRDAGAAAHIERQETLAEAVLRKQEEFAARFPRYETKDSGTREEFPTGSRRDSRDGKGRYDLLSPIAVARVAGVMERGAAKYGDRNWEKGQPLSRYLDSALRHTFQVLAGDTDEDHAGQAVWNLMAFMHTQEKIAAGDLPAELDNLDA